MILYYILALINFIVLLTMGIQWYFGMRKIPFLKDEKDSPSQKPLVSVILAACNEEESIERSIQSIENLDYKNIEIIAVNDRSSDNTGKILEGLHTRDSNLRVLHIKKLPEGWLGKNHALYEGVKFANGEWLLFTDADIIFSRDCLSKAMGYAEKHSLDHLTMFFEITGGSLPYRIFHTFWSIATMWFVIVQKHVGVGAFNLIKRNVYHVVGTHEVIALRPDDDLKLGERVVKEGFKQGLLFGNSLIRVKWYETLRQLMKGFEKNAFAVLNYNVFFVLATVLMTLFFHTYPIIGLFIGDVFSKSINFISLLIIILVYKINKKYFGNPLWYALLNPFTSIVYSYIILRAVFKNLIEGEIDWRGTKYPLKVLKKNRI